MVLRRLRRHEKRAAILGCGPAGIFAAHALVLNGYTISIFSKKRRSEMFGAQYLHMPIPELTQSPAQEITYELRGSAHGYAEKVYDGKLRADQVSPAYLSGPADAWNIRDAYYRGWDYYASLITSMQIDSSSIRSLCQSFDLVVSTIPAPQICADMTNKHMFLSQTAWAVGDAPERGIFCPVTVDPWTVVCNGEDNPHWYRASNVFGYKTCEWPGEKAPPVENIARVEKPLSTNCSCWEDQGNFIRAGRFGTWRKGVLSHEAFYTLRKEYR